MGFLSSLGKVGLGGILGSSGGLFGKTKDQQLSTLTPEQRQMLQRLLGQSQVPLQAGMQNLTNTLQGNESAFSASEQPIIRKFNEETLPGIAEQFAGAGGLQSSAFGGQMAKAGTDLSTNLSALRSGKQDQAMEQLMKLLGLGMGTQGVENIRTEQPGIMDSIGKLAPLLMMM